MDNGSALGGWVWSSDESKAEVRRGRKAVEGAGARDKREGERERERRGETDGSGEGNRRMG